MDNEKQLSAPQVDTLIYRAEKLYEIIDAKTKGLVTELFQKLQSIAVCGDDELRELWLTAPRGSIEDFGDYENYLEDGEVESHKEFEELWLSEYPEPQKWYKLSALVYRGIYSVFINNKLVLQINPEPVGHYPYDKSELASWVLTAAEEAIECIKSGVYNEYVSNNLPYKKRLGKILRKDYWGIFPEEREKYLKYITPAEISRFVNLIKKQPTETPESRLPEITAVLFFNCCRLGYEANSYEGIEKLSAKELYRKHADGRDEGLLGLDESSAEAFEAWCNDKTHFGGHPWEVCRGGNSTHISLYAKHDEKGWWLKLAGSSLNRSIETVKFYLALADNNMPVFLTDGMELAAMLTGTDYIGIVPEKIIPRYCSSMFSDENMIDFMNLPYEGREKVEQAAYWYPLPEVRLSNPDDELDAAITEAEAEYASDDQLIDAKDDLSHLKNKHFGKNFEAMRTLQEEMSDEFEKVGINSEEDIQKLVREVRAEIEKPNAEKQVDRKC